MNDYNLQKKIAKSNEIQGKVAEYIETHNRWSFPVSFKIYYKKDAYIAGYGQIFYMQNISNGILCGYKQDNKKIITDLMYIIEDIKTAEIVAGEIDESGKPKGNKFRLEIGKIFTQKYADSEIIGSESTLNTVYVDFIIDNGQNEIEINEQIQWHKQIPESERKIIEEAIKSRNEKLVELSDEQYEFVNFALKGNNILVDACIGSGKTTAIQQLCIKLAKNNKKVLYLTYNRLLRFDAQEKIREVNITVENYHSYATKILNDSRYWNKYIEKKDFHTDCVDYFVRCYRDNKLRIDRYDVLIIDEYQDIETNSANMLIAIKESNPDIQIIVVGDMNQKIYDKTSLDVREFIDGFLNIYEKLQFTLCFRLNNEYAKKLGNVWNKEITGVNENCKVEVMTVDQVVSFLAEQNVGDILCLGARYGHAFNEVLDLLESNYPNKFNKNTVYASVKESNGKEKINSSVAIFTTFDGSKGLERKICVIFDFTESYRRTRVNKLQQKGEILKNIFCVAASRGKEHIIFVPDSEVLLTDRSLTFPDSLNLGHQIFDISEMFNFKFDEDIRKCFDYLSIKKRDEDDCSKIDIQTNDGQIDLFPFIEIYQSAMFFSEYDIKNEIEYYALNHDDIRYMKSKYHPETTEKSILLLMSMKTSQERYIKQINPDFISEVQKNQLFSRLKTLLNSDISSINHFCEVDFATERGEDFITAKGNADVIIDGTVYSLKFRQDLSDSDFLSCAFFVYASCCEKGVLWNIYDNSIFDISITDKTAFINQVAITISKGFLKKYYSRLDDNLILPSMNLRKDSNDHEERYSQEYELVIEDNVLIGIRGDISVLNIPEGVTEIGKNAFEGCLLIRVVIPKSVKVIGDSAFKGCPYLNEVTIPFGVQSIGENAFSGCVALESIVLPDSLTYIGSGLFDSCKYLKNVSIPSSLKCIGDNMFSKCIYLNSITIPGNIESIGDYAFYECRSLVDIKLADGLKTIGRSAFHGCLSLRSLVLPDSITTIGDHTFCRCLSLRNLVLPDSVTTIGNHAFYGLHLTTINIPLNLINLGNSCFKDCVFLNEIQYNAIMLNDLTTNNGVFESVGQSDNGINVTFGKDVKRIPAYLFNPHNSKSNAPNIIRVKFAENIQCETIGDYAFSYCDKLQYIFIPNTVKNIGNNVFSNCSSLKSISLPDGICTIGEYAFEECNKLKNIILPESLLYIGTSAFKNCSSLIDINLPDCIKSVENSLFYGCSSLENISIPCSVISIGESAFDECIKLNNIVLPSNIKSIKDSVFFGCSSLKSISIPNSVTSIADNAFNGCSRLEELILPDNVEFIGKGVLSGCSSIVKFDLPLCTKIIPDNMFSYCSSLKRMTIPEGVAAIGDNAFTGCNSLEEITIPESVESIGQSAFKDCSSILDIKLPDNIKELRHSVFAGCSSLKTFTIPDDIVSIGKSAFENCKLLDTISIPDSVKSIGACAFRNCVALKDISLPEFIDSISDSVFQGCASLIEIAIPNNVKSIGAQAFDGCNALQEITIPENVKSIGRAAYQNCNNVTKIYYNATSANDSEKNNMIFAYAGNNDNGITLTIGANVTKIPAYMFSSNEPQKNAYMYGSSQATKICANIECVVFEENSCCISIGDNAFANCYQLKYIELPYSLTAIGAQAFDGCSKLDSVNISEKVISVGKSAFEDCFGLTVINYNAVNLEDLRPFNKVFNRAGQKCNGIKVNIGEMVERIPANLFNPYSPEELPKIIGVEFAGNSKCVSIGGKAFCGVTYNSVTIPESVKDIGDGAFKDTTPSKPDIPMDAKPVESSQKNIKRRPKNCRTFLSKECGSNGMANCETCEDFVWNGKL